MPRNRHRESLPHLKRSAQRRRAPRYKIVSLSLYQPQAQSLDRAAEDLRQAGFLTASRSFVIQRLVERVLQGKSAREIVAFFDEEPLRKPAVPVSSRRVRKTSTHNL